MTNQGNTNPNGRANQVIDDATPMRRMLVAIDESPAAKGALDLAAEWASGHEAEVRFVRVAEERRHRQSDREAHVRQPAVHPEIHLVVSGSTLGARNRQLVHGIAEAARDFGADVIVLGFDRPRLAGHRLARSLREQVMRVSELPVLVAPKPLTDAKRHHRIVPIFHHDEERTHAERRYAHV